MIGGMLLFLGYSRVGRVGGLYNCSFFYCLSFMMGLVFALTGALTLGMGTKEGTNFDSPLKNQVKTPNPRD